MKYPVRGIVAQTESPGGALVTPPMERWFLWPTQMEALYTGPKGDGLFQWLKVMDGLWQMLKGILFRKSTRTGQWFCSRPQPPTRTCWVYFRQNSLWRTDAFWCNRGKPGCVGKYPCSWRSSYSAGKWICSRSRIEHFTLCQRHSTFTKSERKWCSRDSHWKFAVSNCSKYKCRYTCCSSLKSHMNSQTLKLVNFDREYICILDCNLAVLFYSGYSMNIKWQTITILCLKHLLFSYVCLYCSRLAEILLLSFSHQFNLLLWFVITGNTNFVYWMALAGTPSRWSHLPTEILQRSN